MDGILVMENINILIVLIIVMVLKRKMFVLLTVSFKLIFHKIEILLLTLKLLKRDKDCIINNVDGIMKFLSTPFDKQL